MIRGTAEGFFALLLLSSSHGEVLSSFPERGRIYFETWVKQLTEALFDSDGFSSICSCVKPCRREIITVVDFSLMSLFRFYLFLSQCYYFSSTFLPLVLSDVLTLFPVYR